MWLRSEGERLNGKTEEAELQALWGHAISPWWDVVAGVRQDFKPGDPQTWAAFGVQGMALYNFEAEATAFIGEGGQSAARLEGDYDILLTNRLILQPTAEVNFYDKNDPARGVAQGCRTPNSAYGCVMKYAANSHPTLASPGIGSTATPPTTPVKKAKTAAKPAWCWACACGSEPLTCFTQN